LRAAPDVRVEQLELHPIRPQHAPGRQSDPPDEQVLEGALGHELGVQRFLERPELGQVLVGEQDELVGPQAVLQRVLRGARVAFGRRRPARLRPRDFAPLRRLASARVLLLGSLAEIGSVARVCALISGARVCGGSSRSVARGGALRARWSVMIVFLAGTADCGEGRTEPLAGCLATVYSMIGIFSIRLQSLHGLNFVNRWGDQESREARMRPGLGSCPPPRRRINRALTTVCCFSGWSMRPWDSVRASGRTGGARAGRRIVPQAGGATERRTG
jgi:hypothetical protein